MDPKPPAAGNGKPIVIIGSLNMDLVMRTPRMPESGETLLGRDFRTVPGGKGANQAVACARLGGRAVLVGRVGADGFGRTLREGLVRDGVDVARLGTCANVGTGVAVILVEDSGQNRILLAAGANGELDAGDLDRAGDLIRSAAMVVLQLEVPLETVVHAVDLARAAGVPVLLNPAPARPLPEGFLARISLLVLNETEATLLAGLPVSDPPTALEAGRRLLAQGTGAVLVTLGAQGVAVVDNTGARHHPAHAVTAVDTTAAGDTFIGGLAVALGEGRTLDEAVALGQRASALCVTRPGAQPSIPHRRELD
jgi:ribokinase